MDDRSQHPAARCAETDEAQEFGHAAASRSRPIVLRGAVSRWPIVEAARGGVHAAARTLAAFDTGRPLHVFTAPPGQGGRYFYAQDMRGLNFGTERATLTQLLAALLDMLDRSDPPALYAGAALASENLKAFGVDHEPPLRLEGAEARIWVGNRSTIATHFDMSDNVACVAAGRRRFTLFPPEEVSNLYVGPLERTPAGQPVSMVDPAAADPDRHPRFADARRRMTTAELGPGDAIYVPALWWHQVAALDGLNVLVNYWATPGSLHASPVAALIHSAVAIRDLPALDRAAWRSWFDHYVFGDGACAAADHLPPHARGVLGPAGPERDDLLRRLLEDAANGLR